MIKRENLERFLERGETLGFIKETNNQAFLGWILLSKQKLPERHLELITANEETQVVKKQDKISVKPYQIRVLELSREAYEKEDYASDEVYHLNENYRFSNLDEVEEFIKIFGYSLEEIKWPIDIGAP